MPLRLLVVVWFFVMLGLLLLTLADVSFGRGRFEERVRALPLRCGLAVVWPLALLSPRGRELLFSRWRQVP